MKILLVLNDAPYGSEKVYNGLRLAMALQQEEAPDELLVFLMADAVTSALPDHDTPNGYYNVERMLKSIVNKNGKVKLCGTCAKARGIESVKLIEGVQTGTMPELAQWTREADKVLVF